jgi:hypothetical protein
MNEERKSDNQFGIGKCNGCSLEECTRALFPVMVRRCEDWIKDFRYAEAESLKRVIINLCARRKQNQNQAKRGFRY